MSAGSSSDDAIICDSGDEATNISESEQDDELDECGRDMTLVDDDDFGYDPNNEGQMMFLQVVEMLREEQEVWIYFTYEFCISLYVLIGDILIRILKAFLSILTQI